MMQKLPIINSPATLQDIWNAASRITDGKIVDEFGAELNRYTGLRHIELTNSGVAAYYVILKALKARYQKTEVILPAYTAGSLVVAVRKAGLKPVLCDISLADFNADVNELMKVISDRTLAVTCIHMFGIGMEGIARVREGLPPATVLIEDCAQSMGSTIGGRPAGTFGDVSFFSFNRGKNFPLSGGGCIATNSDILSAVIKGQVPSGDCSMGISGVVNSIMLNIASKPHVYGPLYHMISRFKETIPPEDIDAGLMTNFQAALGMSLAQKREELFARRRANGIRLMNALKDMEGILVPVISAENSPVFNRLPIVFEDASMRTRSENLLWDRGIETSRMYLRPLHHMFDLGYRQSEFPHANYFAQRLLTLPVHQGVTAGHIDTIIGAIKNALM